MKKRLKKMLANFLKKFNAAIVTYKDPRRSKIFDLILKIHSENHFLMGYNEAYQLYMCVERTNKIGGNIAEVGAYRGSSSKLICEAKGQRPLFVFDTFEGLPDPTQADGGFKKGDFSSSFEFVKEYLSNYPNVTVIKGYFPDTATPIENKEFSFVNLDVDLYESTKKCLNFFYTRLKKGGVLLSHDYSTLSGVKRAFDEFFEDKPEVLIEMSGSQCLFVKL